MVTPWFFCRLWRVVSPVRGDIQPAPMQRFTLNDLPLRPELLRQELRHPSCGGYVAFEGWVRDHNEGRTVLHLEYEAFAPLAISEAERILAEAQQRFGVERAYCEHRVGAIAVGELAVWVGVSTAHRAEAFDACRYIIDQVKHRLPIWKKEYYQDGDSGWVNCERCAALTTSTATETKHEDAHQPQHAHGAARSPT